MTLSSGAISFVDINTELGLPAGGAISLNDTMVRQLANKAAGAISLSDLHGKTALNANFIATGSPVVEVGYDFPGGTISNTTYKGSIILRLADVARGSTFNLIFNSFVPVNFFRAITINGFTLLSSAATMWNQSGSTTTFYWAGEVNLQVNTTYQFLITD
jgi:hypothetical protein